MSNPASVIAPASAPVTRSRRPSARWIFAGVLLTLVLLALRIWCAANYRVDSDEPQHVHVVWGVAKGLVQYRDIFDNHSPLFQMLCAPLFRALGERADIVVAMRMAMLPLYFGCVACVYWIGSNLFSRGCGLFAALFLALHPRFFTTSLEFRPDNLWALAWLLALLSLTCVRRPLWRWLLTGLCLGVGFSVSMKTTVMALDLFVAGALAWRICRKPGTRISLAAPVRNAGLLLAGIAVVPALLFAHFARLGALPNAYYCLIRHNLIATSEHHYILDLRGSSTLLALAGALWFAIRMHRSTPDPALAARRVFVILAGAAYPVILFILWPLNTREDLLAMMPVIAMAAAPMLFAALDAIQRRLPYLAGIAAVAPSCFLITFLTLDMLDVRPWHNRTRFHEDFVANTLKLTDPGDRVLDTKGEVIYRDRPYYYVLEEMTRWMFKREILPDDLPQRILDNGVCVAAYNAQRYPMDTAQFLRKNFIPVAFRVLVAGKILRPPPEGGEVAFQIAIPTEYALVAPRGLGEATLDGKPYQGPVTLTPGRHTLHAAPDSGRVAVVWAQSVHRGFNPFYRPSPDEKLEAWQAIKDNIL